MQFHWNDPVNPSSSHKNVNIGLIGCGGRLRGVVQGLLKQDSEHRIRMISAYDPDPASRKAARELFENNFRMAASEEELVSDPQTVGAQAGIDPAGKKSRLPPTLKL